MNEITIKKVKSNFDVGLTKFIIQKLLFVMIFFSTISLNAQIHIGQNGTTTTSSYPIYGLFDYSYSQQIVLASEYLGANGAAGPITQIKWKITTNGNGSDYWNNWTVYLGHTSKTSFSSETDYVPFSTLTQVYSGVITFDGNNTWVTVTLNTPFNYDGTSNLVVAAIDNASGWGNTPAFASYSNQSTTNRGLNGHQDGSTININNPGNTNSIARNSMLAQIQFNGTINPCASPENITITRTHNSANVTWDNNANATGGYTYELRTSGEAGSGDDGLVQSGNTTAGVTNLVITNLLASTDYVLYLKSNCAAPLVGNWNGGKQFSTYPVVPSPWFEGFATNSTPLGFSSNMTLSNVTNTNPGSTGYFYRYNIYGSGSYSSTYIETINVGPLLTGDKFSFDYSLRTYSGYNPAVSGTIDFNVEISTDYGVTYTSIDAFDNEQNSVNSWTHYEIDIPSSYIGQIVRVKITATNNTGDSYLGIDNLHIGSCDIPISTLNINKTSNTANLNWPEYSGNTYEIQYGQANFQLGTGTTTTSVSNDHQITNLTQGTVYHVYVRNSCSANKSAWLGPYIFTTEPVSPSPWFEGFANSTIPIGFTSNMSLTNATNTNPGSTGYFYRMNIYSYNPTGNVTTTNVGPVLAGDKFSFNYSLRNWSGYTPADSGIVEFDVQISTDYGATYTSVDTFSNDFNETNTWSLYQYTFPSIYIGQVVRVKVTATHNEGDSYLGIDNFYIGNCDLPSALSIAKTDVTANLNWENYTGNNYEIQYGLENFEFGTGTTLNNVTNNQQIAGLTSSTTYHVYVRNTCTSSQSAWIGPFSFTTETVVPSPWLETLENSTNPTGFVSNATLTNSGTIMPNATSYYYYRNLYGSTASTEVSTVNVGPVLSGDFLSFYYGYRNYYSDGESLASLEVQISTDFGNTYSSLTTFNFSEDIGWKVYNYALDSFVGEKIKVKFIYTLEEGDIYVALDNFYVGPCGLPEMPEVLTLTSASATLGWNDVPTSNYQIQYGEENFTLGEGTIATATNSGTTITGLTANTTYTYYLRKTCLTNSSSSWFGPYKFKTLCDPFVGPFSEDFADIPTGSSSNPTIPDCWSFYKGGGNGYGYVTSTSLATPRSFYIYNSYDVTSPFILISPETQNLGEGNYRVRFNARTGSSGEKLIFGTMTNPLDSDTFTTLQVIDLPTSYNENSQEYVIYLPAGTADYFAFKHGNVVSYSGVYIDDIFYEETPACPEPSSLNANPNFQDLSATLSWDGPQNSTNNNFSIEWGEIGFEQGEGTIVTSTTYSTVVTNLTLGETYEFYVKRNCTGENTEWVGPLSFEMDYCTSDFGSFDGNGVTSIVITGEEIEYELDQTYQLIEDSEISLDAEVEQDIAVTFETGFSTSFKVYIDFNNNGFDQGDFVAHGYNIGGQSTTTSALALPNTGEFSTGSYRMRIITEYSDSISGPCENGSWGQTFDLYVNITFPCIQPTDINIIDVGYDFVLMDWEGQGNSNFEIEYGVTGFTQGSGTTITNVTKPYTLENLTPGTTYDFYIRKNCTNINSDWSEVETVYVFCDTPTPTGPNSQQLVQDELISDLEVNGQNLKYYLDYNRTQEVPATTAVQTSATYFVTQTINCESDDSLIINLNVLPRIAQPIVATNQNFCDGGTIGDIEVTSLAGATVIWYQTLTSTQALPATTTLATGNYYVVQTDGITTSHRVLVQVTVNPTPANLVPQPIHLCGEYTFGSVTINNLAGTTVKWYASINDTTPISNNLPITTGTYYVTQSFGMCESEKVPYQVAQFGSLNKPLAGTQTICNAGTVADLNAQGVQGADILWYASLNSTTVLPANTPLATGTYYVAQTMNGCYSEKRAVAVRVISIAAPQVNPFMICGSGTIADLIIPAATGVTFKWYNSPTSTTELAQNTALSSGTYFVERDHYGCISARTAVQVTIGNVPDAPTGSTTQTFVEGSTIANLVIDQTNITWYSTYNDSQNGTNPLSLNLPLENGKTYYAVIIGTNGCPSLPLAITVDIYLSNDEFVKSELNYYPNPVIGILNLSYSERITQIEVFDLLGKRIKTLNVNDNNVELDLSDLSSGTYMIQLKSETKEQFIKIIKK